jgi:pimeloyl-ACP methyl ester carboxylesterase
VKKEFLMEALHVERFGDGPPVLLVHGAVLNGGMAWAQQRHLADRWTLVVPDLRGFWPNPPADGQDFEVDAKDITELLGDGMHLVGFSYGGVGALLAAAQRPEAVRSLTVIEPPAVGIVRGDPSIEAFVAWSLDFWANGPRDPEAFLRSFLQAMDANANPPSPLPPPLLQHARLLQHGRQPWEAKIPLADLRAMPFPKLVVSGGHSPVFEAVANKLECELGAERAVITGAGHSVQMTGAPFNERLERFLAAAEATRP